ncbi:MAG TPA: NAD(P)-dependent oxidoreductase [Rhizomicrobium sp.]|jgi:nucleoside-diphosphate-sugar epimerase
MRGTVLVTGAQGFLGRYVVAELMRGGADVVGLGRSEHLPGLFTHDLDGRRAPLPSELRASDAMSYVQISLEDTDGIGAVLRRFSPRRVIHLAGALRDEPWPVLEAANVTATASLCRAIAAMPDPPSLLVGSSGSVYGRQRVVPVSEQALPDPVGPYGATKLMAEIAARALLDRGIAVARIFNLLGPGLQRRHLAADLAHRIAAIEAGRARAELRLGSLMPVRDFIDVRDAARAIAHWPNALAQSTANIASGQGIAVGEIVSCFIAASGCEIAVAHEAGHDRPGADVMIADMARGAVTGELIALERSVADMLAYARQTQEVCHG